MQILSPIQLPESERQRLKSWLQSRESELFVEALRARSYIATLRAGELLKLSIQSKDRRGLEAEGEASLAGLLDFMVEEMERVSKNDDLMVRLTPLNPLNKTEDQPEE